MLAGVALGSRSAKLSAFAALLTAIVCTQDARAAQDTASVALAGDVPSLDASQDSSPIGYNVRLNLYDQLTEVREDGSLAPRLATLWEASPDALTWTFTVRPGVKFHDGSTLTTDDVVWTYQKILADPRAPTRVYLTKVKSIEKVGDDKVRFQLTEPFALFDRQVTFVSILPRKAFEAMGAEKFGQSPVGSGPYKLVRWVKDDRIEFTAFDDYWRGKPKVKTTILRPIPSEASRASALLTGEVDIVPSLPPSLMDNLARRSEIRTGTADGFRVMYLGFNDTNPLLADARFRLSVDAAVDRATLTAKLLRGLGVRRITSVTTNPLSPPPTILTGRAHCSRRRAIAARRSHSNTRTTTLPWRTKSLRRSLAI
jgi:peptide/nickel transport system substrate-binding protein